MIHLSKLLLLLAIGCSSVETVDKDYMVRTHNGVFRCEEYNHGAYGAAAKDCRNITTGEHVDLIPNPLKVMEFVR